MLNTAAHDGARKALSEIGLGDEGAAEDMKTLRSLLDAWNSTKRIALESFVRTLVQGLLAVFILGIFYAIVREMK